MGDNKMLSMPLISNVNGRDLISVPLSISEARSIIGLTQNRRYRRWSASPYNRTVVGDPPSQRNFSHTLNQHSVGFNKHR